MPERTRLKREPPARGGPIRNPAVPGPRDSSARDGRGHRRARSRGDGEPAAQGFAEAADAAMKGAVERGVETAYRVYEEYMLRGREAARRHQEGPTQEGDMSYGRQSGNDWSGPWGPMAAMMAPWMQMTRMWMDCMGAFVPGAGGMGTTWANQFTPCGSGAWGGATRACVPVQVRSRRLVEVTVDLDPGAECSPLEAARLRHQGGQDRYDLAEFVRQEGRLRLRVTVNDEPEGWYHGDVFDDCGVKRGEIAIQIHPEPENGRGGRGSSPGSSAV